MRLNTLSQYDDRTAKAILAAAALANDGVPYQSDNVVKYRNEAQAVLAEIRSRFDADLPDERAAEAVSKVLSQQVVEAIMGGKDPEAVTRRMGLEGRLPISGYKISFAKHFERDTKESEKYIRRVIKDAQDVQHLVDNVQGSDINPTRGMTLVLIPQTSRNGQDHWLMIDAIRIDDRLIIDRAFRVFPSVVDLSSANEPLDVLRAFAAHYGEPFSIERSARQTFFEGLLFYKDSKKLAVDFNHESDIVEVFVVGSSYNLDPEKAKLVGLPLELSTVTAAYSVNLTKYRKDRLKHL